MTSEDFAELVRSMRSMQKAYFKTRNRDVLEEAQRLEHAVDRELEERTQPRLFRDPGEEGRVLLWVLFWLLVLAAVIGLGVVAAREGEREDLERRSAWDKLETLKRVGAPAELQAIALERVRELERRAGR